MKQSSIYAIFFTLIFCTSQIFNGMENSSTLRNSSSIEDSSKVSALSFAEILEKKSDEQKKFFLKALDFAVSKDTYKRIGTKTYPDPDAPYQDLFFAFELADEKTCQTLIDALYVLKGEDNFVESSKLEAINNSLLYLFKNCRNIHTPIYLLQQTQRRLNFVTEFLLFGDYIQKPQTIRDFLTKPEESSETTRDLHQGCFRLIQCAAHHIRDLNTKAKIATHNALIDTMVKIIENVSRKENFPDYTLYADLMHYSLIINNQEREDLSFHKIFSSEIFLNKVAPNNIQVGLCAAGWHTINLIMQNTKTFRTQRTIYNLAKEYPPARQRVLLAILNYYKKPLFLTTGMAALAWKYRPAITTFFKTTIASCFRTHQ